MPFVALAAPKGKVDQAQRVAIYNYKNPRSELANYDLTCPLCGQRMAVRQPSGVVAHFWHPEGCVGGEGESIEHEIGKDAIRNFLQDAEQYRGAMIDFEHWFADVRRRADVFVRLPDGGTEVHEMQLAAITPEELEQRTNDYFTAGVNDVHWWLGGSADNDRNRQWCRRHLGYVDIAEITSDEGDKIEHRYRGRIN